jgi:hypothetical protein
MLENWKSEFLYPFWQVAGLAFSFSALPNHEKLMIAERGIG